MFRIANAREIASARVALIRRLAQDGEPVERRISTPGGAFGRGQMYFCPEYPLWGYFGDEPWEGATGERFSCAFGTHIGEPSDILSPSIEINLPREFTSRHLTGRVVVDPNGLLYLAHKGALKGGRGGDVGVSDFEKLISGFCKENVDWPDRKGEALFVIGAIEDRLFLDRLSEYVKEAERLRELARRNGLGTALRNASLRFKAGSSGKTKVKGSEEHEANRFHERVLAALHAVLKENHIETSNSRHANMLPDLYKVSSLPIRFTHTATTPCVRRFERR